MNTATIDKTRLHRINMSSMKEARLNEKSSFINALSPDAMQGLAEIAVLEHKKGNCIPNDQVTEIVLDNLGWR